MRWSASGERVIRKKNMKEKNMKETNMKETNMKEKKMKKIKNMKNTDIFETENKNTRQGRIVKIMNKQAQVILEGERVTCMLPGSMAMGRNELAAGDFAEIEDVGNGQYRLIRILPRKTSVYRGDRRSKGEEILIAANADQVIAVVTADYFLHQAGFVEAAAIAAKRAGTRTGVFVSKWDTAGESKKAALLEKMNIYRETADFIFAGSAREYQEMLAAEIRGKTTVVVGDRSCGKTSLIYGILGGMGEEGYNGANIPGTHTAELYAGPDETFLIDTPGFRDFALSNVPEEELREIFPEIAGPAKTCCFSSCTHVHEDGCQVIQGLREKKIKRERYDAWQKMAESRRRPSPETSLPKIDYRHRECTESFLCKVCGEPVAPDGAGSRHRNHCPKCLSSVHVDIEPGDRSSLCGGIMDPIGVWVRRDGEWAVIHRCRLCGELSSNRIAADDNPAMLMSIAVRPLAMAPFPLNKLQELYSTNDPAAIQK